MKNLVIFASGNGSNFDAIVIACQKCNIDARVLLLICDKKDAYVIKRAQKRGVPSLVILPKDFTSKEDYEKKIIEELAPYDIDLICLAGYMRIIGDTLLSRYEGKIINTHPSILPSFKGIKAIEQAMEYGVKMFGITIHFVDSSLDGGKIIDQRGIYYNGNDISYIKKRLLILEHRLYISSIKKLLTKL
ncbi:MAG: phosphoribosylglycinamide formyltransferase [Bacteroidales bacterium]